MDTSNNLFEYIPCELLCTGLEEDKLLFSKSQECVFAFVNKLKPIMKYLACPVYFCEKVSVGDVQCKLYVRNEKCMPGRVRGVYVCELDSEYAKKYENLDYLYLREDGTFFLTRNSHGDHNRGYIEGDVWKLVKFEYLVKSLDSILQIAIKKRNEVQTGLKARSERLGEAIAVLMRP